MKTILVTGGAGFIGSNLCRRLLKENNRVICIDNLYSGRLKNIEDILANDNFIFMETNIIDFKKEFLQYNIDEIYNLACPASPPFYQHDPLFTLDTNYLGTKNMLELAREFNAKILQTSTSEVYGDPEVHPQPETYRGNVSTTGIRACYDEGKRISETLCYDYNRKFGVKIKVARIFNTYGPGMRYDDGRVISNFITQALKNEDITVYGDGLQTRSFCFVDDLVDGLIKLMASDSTFIKPVNLGNPGEFTMLELADKVIKLTNSKSNIVYSQLPQDDPTKRKPIIDLAKEKLGWEPKIDLTEGLKKAIEYYKLELER